MTVCRSFYADAIATLYRANRFIVTPSEVWVQDGVINFDVLQGRLDESRFLTRQVVPDSLYHLRSLELTLPPFKRGFDRANSSDHAIRDWNLAINHLANHANLPNLTIVFYLAFGTPEYDPGPESEWGLDDNYFLRRMHECKGDEESALKTHRLLLEPFRKGCLPKRLFLFLEYPWHWSGNFEEFTSPRPEWWPRPYPNRQVLEMERRLEAWVMGNEYDSHALGKKEWRANGWVHFFWISHYPHNQ